MTLPIPKIREMQIHTIVKDNQEYSNLRSGIGRNGHQGQEKRLRALVRPAFTHK